MKSSNTAAILSNMVDNETVKFRDESGTVTTSVTKCGCMFRLSTQNSRGLFITSQYFDRYEENGDTCLALYWGPHVVGIMFTLNMEKE